MEFKGFQESSCNFNGRQGCQGMSRDFKGFQEIPRDFKGFQQISRDSNKSADICH